MKLNAEDTVFSGNNQVLQIKWISSYLVSLVENRKRMKNKLKHQIEEYMNDTIEY